MVDAFASSTEEELHFPDSGSVFKDVSLQMNQWLGVLRSPRGCIVRAVLAGGQSDPELIEEFRKRFLWPRRQDAYRTLRRGIERGELPRDLDLDLVLDTLYGAMYMRFLIRHTELSEPLRRGSLPHGVERIGGHWLQSPLQRRQEKQGGRKGAELISPRCSLPSGPLIPAQICSR